MADVADYAGEREQGFIDAALKEHKNKINRDRDLRLKMEEAGVTLHCKCCGAELEGYDKSYCDAECKQLYEDLENAERRNGN